MKNRIFRNEMACACGYQHTITVSDDGTAHSFGRNDHGALAQLGLGHMQSVSLPTPIPNLPKINQVSCGDHFTVCVDFEGFIWSFGDNSSGQLGTGNIASFNVPQKLVNIPPVLSVSCGSEHTLIITKDSNLWSWGSNSNGQLCHGDTEDRSIPQKTSFSNISNISAVVITVSDNVDWVILMNLKSHQVSFSMHLQTLLNLFVHLKIVYFLIAKEMYFQSGITALANLVLLTKQIRMN